MSYMFEIYYKRPADPKKEAAITTQLTSFGGRLDFREEDDDHGFGRICLTYEFNDFDAAIQAANTLRQLGEHVEGPVDYGT